MAPRTEKEETEFKAVPETITLCVKCGVAGNYSSTTNNSCQKCSNDPSTTASSGGNPMKSHDRPFRPRLNLPQTIGDLKKSPAAPPAKREVSRCSGCRKKVGLTGFKCRCGELFCADHRYSDRHDCSFDYKSAGREAIARENPTVKAAKIVKI